MGVASSRELGVRGDVDANKNKTGLLPAFFAALFALRSAGAQPAPDAGVTDTEIRIGNIMPYTGPLAAFAIDRTGRRPPIST